jgi:hypothetical protein
VSIAGRRCLSIEVSLGFIIYIHTQTTRSNVKSNRDGYRYASLNKKKMTPKEKADELVNRYAIYLRANLMYDEDAEEDAKYCALIAVDEILYVIENPDDRYSSHGLQLVRNWREVKKEIEKL